MYECLLTMFKKTFALLCIVSFNYNCVAQNDTLINYISTSQDVLASVDESKCDFNKTYDLDMSEIIITFLDFENEINITQKVNDFNITDLELDPTKRLVVYAHGFVPGNLVATVIWVAETYKNVTDAYLITINYANYTRNLQPDQYVLAVLRAYYIGRAISQVLYQFRCKGICSENIHCFGNSLGAQVCGYAAEEYTNLSNEKFGRLSGIDPAGLCFNDAPLSEQIRSGLSDFVDVYHCTGMPLATSNNFGDINFNFNSLLDPQPHCEEGSYFPISGFVADPAECSHRMCLTYWLNTVHTPSQYPANSTDGCCDDEVYAGYYNSGNCNGIFNVTSN